MFQICNLHPLQRGGAKVHWGDLYKGLGGNIAGVAPASALFFAVYEPVKQRLLPVMPEGYSVVGQCKL